jgi:hypothetical protein
MPQATGTLKLPVGGRNPGIIPNRLANIIKKNAPPKIGKYNLAFSLEPSILVKRSKRKSMVRISKIVLIENFSSGNTESSLERILLIFNPAKANIIRTRIDPRI